MLSKRNSHSEANAVNVEAEPQPVRIEFCDQEAQKVSITGTFNHWRPQATPMVRVGRGRWMRMLFLSPGRHEFQFIVDGQPIGPSETNKPATHESESLRSVIHIGKPGRPKATARCRPIRQARRPGADHGQETKWTDRWATGSKKTQA